jgi:hypothetical protein
MMERATSSCIRRNGVDGLGWSIVAQLVESLFSMRFLCLSMVWSRLIVFSSNFWLIVFSLLMMLMILESIVLGCC